MAMADLCTFAPFATATPRLTASAPAATFFSSCRSLEVRTGAFSSCILQKQSWGTGRATALKAVQLSTKGNVDTEEWNKQARDARLQHLEAQAMETLKNTVENFERPAFPCALIAGDVVILDLLHRIGPLGNEKVKIIFIDTFHLFPETYTFLSGLEKRYGFKAHEFHAAGVDSKDAYNEKFGSDLFLRVEKLLLMSWSDASGFLSADDHVSPVLTLIACIKHSEDLSVVGKLAFFKEVDDSIPCRFKFPAFYLREVDAMINGRRRDHGADRAHLEVFEGGNMAKVQPLAYWEFRDCWDYLKKYSLPSHPLHEEGFPSIGDVQTTLPVPREKWFEYGGERSGRFQGLKNADGSEKTECGIHVGGPK